MRLKHATHKLYNYNVKIFFNNNSIHKLCHNVSALAVDTIDGSLLCDENYVSASTGDKLKTQIVAIFF